MVATVVKRRQCVAIQCSPNAVALSQVGLSLSFMEPLCCARHRIQYFLGVPSYKRRSMVPIGQMSKWKLRLIESPSTARTAALASLDFANTMWSPSRPPNLSHPGLGTD